MGALTDSGTTHLLCVLKGTEGKVLQLDWVITLSGNVEKTALFLTSAVQHLLVSLGELFHCVCVCACVRACVPACVI